MDGDNSKDVTSCAQTDSQIRPYIEVDLGGTYDIATITIQNVDDVCCCKSYVTFDCMCFKAL